MASRAGKLGAALGVGVGALLILLLAAAITGRPLLSYAKSGSMEPTIGTFDAFFVNPWPGPLHVGDIVVFRSISRGEPSVHRIVSGDASGWYTQGDANAGMDQAVGEPILTKDRVLGRVVTTPDGSPILLRGVGLSVVQARVEWVKLSHRVGGEPQLKLALVSSAAAILALSALRDARAPPEAPRPLPSLRAQRLLRRALPRGILGRHLAIALVLLALASGSYGAMRADAVFDVQMVVVADARAGGDRSAPAGGTLAREVEIGSLGPLPTQAFLEPGSPRLAVEGGALGMAPMTRARAPVWQTAGPDVGLQADPLHVWRYPAVMPATWTHALHRALPGSPYLVMGGALALLGILSVRGLGIFDVPIGGWLGAREDWR